MHQSVVLIGDSIIKNIVPQKLTGKKVYKFTYPGRKVEEIDQEIQNKCSNTEAWNVMIHCGTNNITTDTANVCASKIEQLVVLNCKNDLPICEDWCFRLNGKK